MQWFLSSILASHNAFKDADDGIAVFLCNNDDEEEDAENDGEDEKSGSFSNNPDIILKVFLYEMHFCLKTIP